MPVYNNGVNMPDQKVQNVQEFQEILDITSPENTLDPISLDYLPIETQKACANAGWAKLMPVQAHAIPYIMAQHHMMVQSRTGSGKTGAFLLPLVAEIDATLPKTQALILLPTRELALQVEEQAKILFKDTDTRVLSIYGGTGYKKQLDALHEGVHLVIGTPGRILDHLLRRTLNLDHLKALILDEADRMLSIGFYPAMKDIQRYIRRPPALACLFSATYPPHVLQLAEEFLKNPQMLSLSYGQTHVASTQHFYCSCNPMEKDRVLVRLLETENPQSALIFCNTKANVHYICGVLKGFGYNADELSADLSQSRREQVLARLKNSEVRFLVATDVAARGIDIPALSHVFLYEPPEDKESYIHRAGRTGRAGAAGTVISLVDIMQKLELDRIAKHYKIDMMQLDAPKDEEVAHIAGQRMLAYMETKHRAATGLTLERAKRLLPFLKEITNISDQHAIDEEQLLMLALILDTEYQKDLTSKSASPASNTSSDSNAPKKHYRDNHKKNTGDRY